jgi:hypothetical protein
MAREIRFCAQRILRRFGTPPLIEAGLICPTGTREL